MAAITPMKAGVFSAEMECPLYHPETGARLKDYKINVQRVVVQGAGIHRARPEIPAWQCKVAFEIDDAFVTPQIVEEVFNLAGRMKGVGDFRPERKGPYGRFSVKLVTGTTAAKEKSSAKSRKRAA
jgi:hypothetical protein